MDKKQTFAPPVVGASSLLVIFAVLALVIFALLGLSTVQAGGRLSQTRTQAVTDYYAADSAAEEIFARLKLGEIPEGVTQQDNIYSYLCPISDTQQLRVELEHGPEGWKVLRWQAESSALWESDDTLNVWDGT